MLAETHQLQGVDVVRTREQEKLEANSLQQLTIEELDEAKEA
jgi:hypothetical protein